MNIRCDLLCQHHPGHGSVCRLQRPPGSLLLSRLRLEFHLENWSLKLNRVLRPCLNFQIQVSQTFVLKHTAFMTFKFKYEPSTPEPSPTENLIVSFTGSRFNKTKRALVDLGPAIANAGMTTFLAVIILPASSSHVFLTFFKVGILSSV